MDILQTLVRQGIALHKQQRYDEAEVIYNRILNRDPFNEDLLFLLADLYIRKEYNALGINLLAGLCGRNPNNQAAWTNMGVGFRKENDRQRAMECWTRAIAVGGESPEVCENIAGLYADSGQPHEALKWLEKALAKRPDGVEGNWLKALSLLTLRDWEAGWKQFEWRLKLPSWDSRDSLGLPYWDGKPVDHLYIHGEQGVGDEVMFASAIPHVLKYAKQITLEVNAKVAGIMKQTWPQFNVIKEPAPGNYDAKVAIGSLIGRFGMNTKPFLEPHPDKVKFYRRELEKLGPGPYVAVTWLGGTKMTRVEDRSFEVAQIEPLLKSYTCVSAQYHHDNPYVEPKRIEAGLAKINDASTGEDLHDQAALFKACDAVVTAQQTAVHVAGGVGVKTLALIGERPHWRYGVSGEEMPFYSSVRLLRKTGEWSELIGRAKDILDADFGRVPAREQAAA